MNLNLVTATLRSVSYMKADNNISPNFGTNFIELLPTLDSFLMYFEF